MAVLGTLAVGLEVDARGRFATLAGVLALAVLGGVLAAPVGACALALDVVAGGAAPASAPNRRNRRPDVNRSDRSLSRELRKDLMNKHVFSPFDRSDFAHAARMLVGHFPGYKLDSKHV